MHNLITLCNKSYFVKTINTKFVFIHICLLLLVNGLSGQSISEELNIKKSSLWSFGVNSYAGGVIGYNELVTPFRHSGTFSTEIYASIQTHGKREWERLYNFPRITFIASYYDFGAIKELGRTVGLTANFDYTLLRKEKSELFFSAGMGFAYTSKVFDIYNNYLNTAVSNPISFSPRFSFRYENNLNKKWDLNFHFNFSHFSNGSFNQPNDGLNFFLLGVGLNYKPSIEKINYKKQSHFEYNKNIRYHILMAAGLKEVIIGETNKYSVFSLSAHASKRLTRYNSLLLGIDFFHNNSIEAEYLNELIDPTGIEIDRKQAGITFGTELHVGNLSFYAQGGLYLYLPHKFYPAFYQRYGLKYYLGEVFVNTSVKADWTVPDFVEYGIGIRF